ncbi:3-oxoacid CoA-transferase subunit A [Noviherbaspirillum saxi]|uniref:3-oxoacid CoA-transferase subunit A n=1 Tax=Noviherbaspirillum saxi TaxID=2320863 RepID=A0A3A3FGI2_9BURK|nr:3-oxoacid CoA-transferase subunit A [Noviherbaspirillum saxi]RJF92491.1 3-oxoacid CoA-transferase subunit A [Noviherbaspirillum saxi]
MIDKFFKSTAEAVADIHDGATVLVSGFGLSGQPVDLLDALVDQGARDLTVVCNNSGSHDKGLARLIRMGRVRRLLASYPRGAEATAFETAYAEGRIEYECVPQGTLAERLRAAGAGLGGFFTPTGYGTVLAEGKETRVIDGVGYVFETPLRGDFALVKALTADRWGNLIYRKAGRNFGPLMCMAAKVSVVQVQESAPLGELDPEAIVTPGIFVKRVIEIAGGAVEDRT